MGLEKKIKKRESFLSYPSFQISVVGLHLLGMFSMLGLNALGVTDKHLFAVLALAISSITSACLLVLSHRLVGPVSRLMEILRSLSKGERLTRSVSVRKKDYLKEFPVVVEKIAELLNNSKTHDHDIGGKAESKRKKAA